MKFKGNHFGWIANGFFCWKVEMSHNRELFSCFLKRKNFLLGGLFSIGLSQDDVDTQEEYLRKAGFYVEDKWERIKMIFRKDDFGNYHPEISNAINRAQFGALAGILIGGTLRQMRTSYDYKRNTDATLFVDRREAHLSLVRHNTINFLRGGFTFAPIFGLFIGCFNLFSACMEAYRNKSGVVEYTVGGASVGALFRIHFGPVGILIGGVAGGVLGTIYGLGHLILLKALPVNQVDLKYATYIWQNNKQNDQCCAVNLKETISALRRPTVGETFGISGFDLTRKKKESILGSDSEPDTNKNSFQEKNNNNKEKQFENSK